MLKHLHAARKSLGRKWPGLALCLSLAGCDGLSISAFYYDDGSQEMSFQEVTPVVESAIADRRFVVIRDISAWHALWNEHTAYHNPRPATPAVNFSQNMVLGAFAGNRLNSCYRIAIQSVTRRYNPSRIEATFREYYVTGSCTTAATNPFSLVVTPYSSLPIEYVPVP